MHDTKLLVNYKLTLGNVDSFEREPVLQTRTEAAVDEGTVDNGVVIFGDSEDSVLKTG